MKNSEIKAEIFEKNGKEFTKFIIGNEVANSRVEDLVVCLGGKLTKQTKMFNHYEIEGNQLKLMIIGLY